MDSPTRSMKDFVELERKKDELVTRIEQRQKEKEEFIQKIKEAEEEKQRYMDEKRRLEDRLMSIRRDMLKVSSDAMRLEDINEKLASKIEERQKEMEDEVQRHRKMLQEVTSEVQRLDQQYKTFSTIPKPQEADEFKNFDALKSDKMGQILKLEQAIAEAEKEYNRVKENHAGPADSPLKRKQPIGGHNFAPNPNNLQRIAQNPAMPNDGPTNQPHGCAPMQQI